MSAFDEWWVNNHGEFRHGANIDDVTDVRAAWNAAMLHAAEVAEEFYDGIPVNTAKHIAARLRQEASCAST